MSDGERQFLILSFLSRSQHLTDTTVGKAPQRGRLRYAVS